MLLIRIRLAIWRLFFLKKSYFAILYFFLHKLLKKVSFDPECIVIIAFSCWALGQLKKIFREPFTVTSCWYSTFQLLVTTLVKSRMNMILANMITIMMLMTPYFRFLQDSFMRKSSTFLVFSIIFLWIFRISKIFKIFFRLILRVRDYIWLFICLMWAWHCFFRKK